MMRSSILVYILFLIVFIPPALSKIISSVRDENKNHLTNEKSPYLQQHKNNPIWWYSWSKEAFSKAERENKPIFLSVGYTACYWCHVMEEDSFQSKEVAKILNKYFVSIKVDREERPDIDSIYMNSLKAMTGKGGWPMTIIMTPDRKPFFGGTFMSQADFIELLNEVIKIWNSEERQKLIVAGDGVVSHLSSLSTPKETRETKLDNQILKKLSDRLSHEFDQKYGGFGNAPKFPPSLYLFVLARLYKRAGSKSSLHMYEKTLNEMARGGIYDQLGGGFHRYSIDKKWMIPHFEKMLYGNALLVMNYVEAFQITQREEYKKIVTKTLNYVIRDLTSLTGGFYTSEGADSEKIEGKFYAWEESELKKKLTDHEFKLVKDIYGVTKEGNFSVNNFGLFQNNVDLNMIQNANILYLPFSQKYNLTLSSDLEKLNNKLLKIRNKRKKPFLDKKILTSWNGLMIQTFAKASRIFSNKDYLIYAENAGNFILNNLFVNGELKRRYISGESANNAGLEDYAFLISAFIELYQSSFNPKWLNKAVELQKIQDKLFEDKKGNAYFDTDGKDPYLLVRTKNFSDTALPSGNAVSVLNLLKLSSLTYEDKYHKKAEKILSWQAYNLKENPMNYTMMIVGLDYYIDSNKEIALIADPKTPEAIEILSKINNEFLPNVVLASGLYQATNLVPLLNLKKQIRGKPTIYVCEDKSCKIPTTDINQALKFMKKSNTYSLK